jgi:hypothetical protein
MNFPQAAFHAPTARVFRRHPSQEQVPILAILLCAFTPKLPTRYMMIVPSPLLVLAGKAHHIVKKVADSLK